MTGYEIRFQMWQMASKYHQNKYDFEKAAFDAGLITQKPDFPTEKDIRKTAYLIKSFVEKKS
mgnify:FL=1